MNVTVCNCPFLRLKGGNRNGKEEKNQEQQSKGKQKNTDTDCCGAYLLRRSEHGRSLP